MSIQLAGSPSQDTPRLFPWVFYGLVLLFAVPMFVSPYLPFPDFPVHVGELFILSHPDDPRLTPFYDLSAWLHPYSAHRIVLVPLALLLGADLTYRLYLLIHIVGTPLVVRALVARSGRSPWLTLTVFATLYSYPVVFGFTTYCVATTVLLILHLRLEQFLALDAPKVRHHAGLAGWYALVFLAHPQVLLYALVTTPAVAALYELAHTRRFRATAARVGASMVPALMLLTLYVVRNWGKEAQAFQFFPLRIRFRAFPIYAGGAWKEDTVFLIFYVLVGLVALAGVAPRRTELESWPSALWRSRFFVLVMMLIAGSVVLPEVYGYQHYIASRLIPMSMLLVPMALSDTPWWRGRSLPAAVSALMFSLGVTLITEMMIFQTESRAFSAVVDFMPPGARYRCMLHGAPTNVVEFPAFDGFCSYVLLEKGGYTGPLFEHTGIHYKPGFSFGEDFDAERDFDITAHGDRYDYFVMHAGGAPAALIPGGALADKVTLVLEAGPWRVVKRIAPFNPSPP